MLDGALRPLRFAEIETLRDAVGKYVRIIGICEHLIARAAVIRGDAADHGFAVGAEPDIVVLFRLIESVVNFPRGRARVGIDVEHGFGHFEALILVGLQGIQDQFRHFVVYDGVGSVETKIIDARRGEQFHMPCDHPGIAHIIVTVQRLRTEMKFVEPRFLAVVGRGEFCRALLGR